MPRVPLPRRATCRACGRPWREFSLCPWCGERIGAAPLPRLREVFGHAKATVAASTLCQAALNAAAVAALGAVFPVSAEVCSGTLGRAFPAALPFAAALLCALRVPDPPPVPPQRVAAGVFAQWWPSVAALCFGAAAWVVLSAVAATVAGAAVALVSCALAWPLLGRRGKIAAVALCAAAIGPGSSPDFALMLSAAAFAAAAIAISRRGRRG